MAIEQPLPGTFPSIEFAAGGPAPTRPVGVEPDDPADLILICANCGQRMEERKCKLICRCGYFLSCSDYQ